MKNVYLAPFYWFYYSWESFGVGCSRWKVQDVCGQRAKEYLWSFLNKSFFRDQILLYRLIGSFWQLLSPVHRYWCWWDVWLWQGPKVCCYSYSDSKLFENKLKVFPPSRFLSWRTERLLGRSCHSRPTRWGLYISPINPIKPVPHWF